MIDLEGVSLIFKVQEHETIQTIEKEIQCLSECNDSHITKFYESFIQGSKLFIVMEFVGGGSVRDCIDKLGSIQETYIAIILRELL